MSSHEPQDPAHATVRRDPRVPVIHPSEIANERVSTTGCDRISPGCGNCYALKLAKRLKMIGQPRYQFDGDPRISGPGFGVAVRPETLTEPLRWRHSAQSLCELDKRREPCPNPGGLAQVFTVTAVCPQHSFQTLS
ncbi:protein gp37 [Catenulispora sp. GAS73]|uniref:DUF5131 family protein n=1 Tax=Catenulispora sp. GAS73 TaxID=3156269 RepID=UPI003512B06F